MKTKKYLILSALSLCALVSASCATDPAAGKDPEIYAVYKTYQENGGTLTYEEWLASIKGEKGDKGDKGDTGAQGETGPQGPQGEKAIPAPRVRKVRRATKATPELPAPPGRTAPAS